MKAIADTHILILDKTTAGINWLFQYYGTMTNAVMEDKQRFTEKELKKYSMIIFGGGPDVDPKFYGKEKEPRTVSCPEWDEWRLRIFKQAVKLKIPMVGICGGAQLGCVGSGGTLKQHMDNHAFGYSGRHSAYLDSRDLPDKEFLVSSDHHQLMQPQIAQKDKGPVNYEIIARCAKDHSHEIIWFKDTKFLAAQFHPEWMTVSDTAVRLFKTMIGQYVLEINSDMVKNCALTVLSTTTTTTSSGCNDMYGNTDPVKVYKEPATLLGEANNG